MSESSNNLYQIGALAKMMGISADTLRYYDEIGLFAPNQISPETGYRYYSADQVTYLARIMELKQYGFSLNEIKEILERGEVSLADIYLARYWVLENENKKLQNAIDNLSEKINQKQEKSFMDKKILLVDDAPFMRSICKEFLTKAGYDVIGEACDGLEAVELYKSLKPDIVLLGIVMPNCDGLDALRQMKEYDENVHAIMVSALSRIRVIAEAFLAGAIDFVSKPFQAEALLGKIKASFYQMEAVNYEIAKQIYDAGIDSDKILETKETEMLVNLIRSQATTDEVETLITKIKKESPAEQQGYDPGIEQIALINARLDKLEKGQEEILAMLREMQK